MHLQSVRFFNGGYCRQSARFVGGTSWRWRRFHAVFVLIEHPQHGLSLVDTGYGPEFLQARDGLWARIYRAVLPVTLDANVDAAGVLRAHGVPIDAIRRIFVTHLHADHIAGLKAFPGARLVVRHDAWELLSSANRGERARHLFLPSLLPDDFLSRVEWLPPTAFRPASRPLPDFPVHDYWGDGSLLLVDLPGHAIGHYGMWLEVAPKPIFYVADAAFDLEPLEAGRRPLWFVSRGQQSPAANQETHARLRPLLNEAAFHTLACHGAATQTFVQNRPGSV